MNKSANSNLVNDNGFIIPSEKNNTSLAGISPFDPEMIEVFKIYY